MTIQEMRVTKAKLIAAGWTFVCSMMHSDGATGNYGLLFIKGDADFWLNKDSFTNLPVTK